jgi:hypothetical protein
VHCFADKTQQLQPILQQRSKWRRRLVLGDDLQRQWWISTS